MGDINLWAALVAALSCFLLGGLWYSPILFGKAWCQASGVGPKHGHPARVFGLAFVFALVAAVGFGLWVGKDPTLPTALLKGLVAGACLVAASFGINYQFANRPPRLLAIDGGYHTAQFVLYGLVFGLWPSAQ